MEQIEFEKWELILLKRHATKLFMQEYGGEASYKAFDKVIETLKNGGEVPGAMLNPEPRPPRPEPKDGADPPAEEVERYHSWKPLIITDGIAYCDAFETIAEGYEAEIKRRIAGETE